MDVNDTETVQFNALGGADNIVVHNLAGTDVREVDLNLLASTLKGGGDGVTDNVVVEGTSANDVPLQDTFPFLATPWGGRNRVHQNGS